MSGTKLRTRIFAGLGALLFLVTASALTISVIWDAATNKNKQPTTASSTNDTGQSTSKSKGTPLKDFTPIAKVTELQIIDIVPGTGEEVKAGQAVTVDYVQANAATGEVIESSVDGGEPVTFSLENVIDGWREGIPGMKVGGTRRLVIPTAKAYGANSPTPDIPPNADLVFDVTLKSINK